MKIVVIGGTGLVGEKLVRQLGQAGYETVVAARSTGVDTVTGTGLAEAIAGADVVVDVSNPGYADPEAMLRFFETSGANLFAAERRAGTRHHIAFSTIGTGRIDTGYYRAKDAQEDLVVASGIPFTIVRSTPLFEYIYAIIDAESDKREVRVPPVRMRPIAADDVARVLRRDRGRLAGQRRRRSRGPRHLPAGRARRADPDGQRGPPRRGDRQDRALLRRAHRRGTADRRRPPPARRDGL